MNCKLLLVLSTIICVIATLQAASLREADKYADAVVQKLDYEGVEANVRNARQVYKEVDSGEDSDEDDEEEDAELQHLAAIRHQQAYKQDDGDDNLEENDDDNYFGRRLRRDISMAVGNSETEDISKPSLDQDKQPAIETSSATTPTASSNSDFSNTSVLILIRDVIKKVTEIPNTQQVTTSAQQYFQFFEHFLQQAIEQVIGDDDDEDEDEVNSTTLVPEVENETEVASEASENSSVKPQEIATSDNENEAKQPAEKPEDANQI